MSWFWQRRRDVEEEISAHLAERADELMESGIPQDEALRQARREFGNRSLITESSREVWGWAWLDRLGQDLRYAIKMLRHNPAFTAVVVLTLALGIGANTAVFTLINAVLLQSLPVTNPHRLVELNGFVSFPMYRDLRDSQQVFTGVFAASDRTFRLTLPSNTQPAELDNIAVEAVSGNYFSVLGVNPALGRLLNESDDQNPESSESAGSVVVLSDAFWQRQFGRDPGVLNRTVLIGRSPCRVVGVTPPGFFGDVVGSAPAAWVPLLPFSRRDFLENRQGRFTRHIARLKPGETREHAQAAMTGLYQRLIRSEAPGNDGIDRSTFFLTAADSGGDSFLRQTFAKPLWIVMAIAALVLLITCANVGNLLLARFAFRRSEIAVRLAIGCSRLRLLRQLLTESVLLSLLGAIAGVAIVYWGSHELLGMLTFFPIPVQINLEVELRVVAFLLVVSLGSGLLFGILAGLKVFRSDLAPSFASLQRGPAGMQRHRLSRALVSGQIALSLLLVISAGLLIRSLHNLHSLDWGIRPENVLIFDIAHTPKVRDSRALSEVARQMYQAVAHIPGVRSASVSMMPLFAGFQMSFGIKIPGTQVTEEGVRYDCVSPDYFATLGMRIVEGRSITEEDGPNTPLVAVINEAMARRYFDSGNALGRTFVQADGSFKDKPVEIVGIVHDSKYNDLRQEAKPLVYLPIRQVPDLLSSIEVRTDQSAAVLTGAVRGVVAGVTKDIMIRRIATLSDQVDQTLAAERLVMRLCSFFGILALLLACLGLYGVLSYALAQRTGEIGIRMALGATPRAVIRMILADTLWMLVIGVAGGWLLALGCTRFISSLVFGLTTKDPETTASAIALLLAAAFLASYLPARRASRIDPAVALRGE
jgi:predicted permease